MWVWAFGGAAPVGLFWWVDPCCDQGGALYFEVAGDVAPQPPIDSRFNFFQGPYMPIYAYRCGSCGHAQDVLQKISDPLLTQCPACGAAAFQKQVTAAGFQLKGTGWYVTDFRGGSGGASGGAVAEASAGAPGAKDAPAATSESKPAETSSPAASAKPVSDKPSSSES